MGGVAGSAWCAARYLFGRLGQNVGLRNRLPETLGELSKLALSRDLLLLNFSLRLIYTSKP